MRLNMRQGVVSHQDGGFLQVNPSLNIDLQALNRPMVVSVAHHDHNYLHSEDSTIVDAWQGPFNPVIEYWLYIDFNLLTFQRTFGFSTLEPVAQALAPGADPHTILQAVAGIGGLGRFVVDGHFVLPPDRPLAVTSSTTNNGTYTVSSTTFDSGLNTTTIFVQEDVLSTDTTGIITLDIDINGIPMLTDGRMWYDTNNHVHYVLQGTQWTEILRVVVAKLGLGGLFTSESITSAAGSFTGTQIGDESSVLSGRVIFTENSNVIRRDDRSFLTVEDQFFTNQSRVDAIRLESNVARGQSTESALAAFSVVAYVADGKIGTAQYNHITTTVVGMLTENIFVNEVGGVILQGVITNPAWTWTSGPNPTVVGAPLWVDNGVLVPVDPHVTDVLSYPNGRVPIARVLDDDTIIFEQGLGGVGDQGPPGSLEDLPFATTTSLGAVTLVTPSSDPQQAFVITDTDPRLTDARVPLPHNHSASEVLFVPNASIISNTVQLALEELGTKKLDLAGGIMTGPITLFSDPTIPLHAATKQYVDALVSGLVWLEPILLINVISDSVAIPPTSPETSDAYIVPPGAVGDWSAIPSGSVVVWDGSVWLDRGPVTTLSSDARFGIAMQSNTVPSGSFVGKKNQIAIYDNTGTLTGFEIPTHNNAVYVSSTSSLHAYNQFAFSGTQWVLFNGAHSAIPSLEILTDTDTVTTAPNNGDALVYNSTTLNWEPGTVATSGGGSPYSFVTLIPSPSCGASDPLLWVTNGLTWNNGVATGSPSNSEMLFFVTGTWNAGFRPTYVDVTINVPVTALSSQVQIVVRDTDFSTIGNIGAQPVVLGTEVTIRTPIIFGTKDLNTVEVFLFGYTAADVTCINFDIVVP